MIEVKNLSKKYKSKSGAVTIALENVNLKFPKNGLIAIVGKSGSGKSTLLNILAGLDKSDQGEILLNNKNILKFNSNKLNSYRNTYLGFIFQDYNLISNLNVKENLEIALELQKQKNDRLQIENILKKLDLTGFEKRKINELSGGQKQRVAIGRALIKEPQIILADEPTGNLDSITSKEIFGILKEISKEKLVILVTHDYDSAEKYADGICEISDGNITKNTIKNVKNNEVDLTFKKGRLTFFKSIKYAFANLRRKKLRMIITTLIMSVSIFVFSFLLMLTNFDVNEIHAETLINNSSSNLTLIKNSSSVTYNPFAEEEIESISSLVNNDLTYYPTIVSGNNYTSFDSSTYMYADDEKKEEITLLYKSAYYSTVSTSFVLYPLSEEELLDLDIIGSLPENSNEVMIPQYLADQLLVYGVMILSSDYYNGTYVEYTEAKFFDSYEDIINYDTEIYIDGSNYETKIKITGIVMDSSLEDYSSFKDELFEDMYNNPTDLYNDFVNSIKPALNTLVVTEDFMDTMDIEKNSELDTSFYPITYTGNDNRFYYYYGTSYITDEVNVFNGTENITYDSLDDDEIILSSRIVSELYSNYNTEFSNYISSLMTTYQNQIDSYNKNVEAEQEKLLDDPDYVIKEFEYPETFDYDEETINFLYEFIEENNVIGSTITIEITDTNSISDSKVETFANLTVVGVYLESDNKLDNEDSTFVSKNILEKYMRSNFEITSLYFEEDNYDNLLSLFTTFNNSDKYTLKSTYTNTIEDLTSVVANIEPIAKYVALGTLVFVILLFMNFIINSINSRKKDVGILRAIGASSFDIYKMFYLETTLIAILSLTIATILSIIGSNLANIYISKNIFNGVMPIQYNYQIIVYMIIFIFVFVTIISMIGLIKISKVKPIKLIYEK